MGDLPLRKEVITSFKLHGLTIRKEACSLLVDKISSFNSSDKKKYINDVVMHIHKQQLNMPIVETVHLELSIKDINSRGSEDVESIFNVIDVFRLPKFVYSLERKKFIKDNQVTSEMKIFSTAKWRAQFLINRYEMILQRTLRNKLFATEAIPGTKSEKVFNLKYIENLLSSSSRIDEVIVLGLLTQLTEGTFYLEDLTGVIPLNLSATRYHSGLFTEHCFVLAEGYFEDGTLNVMGLVMPPAEERTISQMYYGNLNTFGGTSSNSLKNSENLIKLERENDDAMIIFLSDVWLDDVKVMSKLKSLFTGYDNFPPLAMVFTGDFLSCSFNSENMYQLKNSFKSLGELIKQFPQLMESCKFVFVPGNNDPPSTNLLPRQPIPDCLTEDIRSILGGRAVFATNPCRIQYCTQEIVVLRQNLVTKICRNAMHFPETGDIPEHLAKTLLSQCTLCPLTIGIQPVYWQHADALNLYPMPDLVVLADSFKPYTRTNQDCTFINPGSFPRTDFSFKVYMPSTKTVEDSQIPQEDEQ